MSGIKIFDCVVCGEKDNSFFAKKNSHNIYKCSGCGILSVCPLPNNSEDVYVADYFSGGHGGFGYVDYDADKEAMRSVFESYLELIEKMRGGKKGKLLDVGAATGFFAGLAETRGWDASGIEISDYAALVGRKKGLNILTGTIDGVNFDYGSFDVVTMWDVLEHLPDPKKNLNKVGAWIKKGGMLAISTPDSGSLYAKVMGSKWHLLVPPEHIHYFSKPSLRIVLRDAGFEIVKFAKIGKKFTAEYIFHILRNWSGISLFGRIADFIKSRAGGKISVPINLRDNIFVFAVRK